MKSTVKKIAMDCNCTIKNIDLVIRRNNIKSAGIDINHKGKGRKPRLYIHKDVVDAFNENKRRVDKCKPINYGGDFAEEQKIGIENSKKIMNCSVECLIEELGDIE